MEKIVVSLGISMLAQEISPRKKQFSIRLKISLQPRVVTKKNLKMSPNQYISSKKMSHE